MAIPYLPSSALSAVSSVQGYLAPAIPQIAQSEEKPLSVKNSNETSAQKEKANKKSKQSKKAKDTRVQETESIAGAVGKESFSAVGKETLSQQNKEAPLSTKELVAVQNNTPATAKQNALEEAQTKVQVTESAQKVEKGAGSVAQVQPTKKEKTWVLPVALFALALLLILGSVVGLKMRKKKNG